MPPRNSTGEFAELFQVPPAATETPPVNNLAPVADDMVRFPLDPPPMVVVPVSVSAKAAAVKVVPSPTFKFPPIVKAAPVVAVADPLKVRLPPMVVIAPNVSAPPLKVRFE